MFFLLPPTLFPKKWWSVLGFSAKLYFLEVGMLELNASIRCNNNVRVISVEYSTAGNYYHLYKVWTWQEFSCLQTFCFLAFVCFCIIYFLSINDSVSWLTITLYLLMLMIRTGGSCALLVRYMEMGKKQGTKLATSWGCLLVTLSQAQSKSQMERCWLWSPITAATKPIQEWWGFSTYW